MKQFAIGVIGVTLFAMLAVALGRYIERETMAARSQHPSLEFSVGFSNGVRYGLMEYFATHADMESVPSSNVQTGAREAYWVFAINTNKFEPYDHLGDGGEFVNNFHSNAAFYWSTNR